VSSDFIVRGVKVTVPGDSGDLAEIYGSELDYRPRGGVSLAADRAGGTPVELPGEDDDIVEIEDTDGVVTFQHAGALLDRAGATARGDVGTPDLTSFLGDAARGDGGRVAAVHRYGVTLPPQVVSDIAEVQAAVDADIARSGVLRGGLGMIAGVLPRVLFDPAAKEAMKRIVAWADAPARPEDPVEVRRRKPKQRGLYRIEPDLRLEPQGRLGLPPDPAGDQPYLLLLHGTFSHTEAAFTELRGSTEWARTANRYHGRLLALEHATLGLTPAQNALDAARVLPEGARLHLISHSRGGLVGEALSYAAAVDPADRMYVYDHVPEHPDVQALPELRRVLVERGITVERFVRVACPARGTTLASQRLDRWASLLFNVFKLVPVLRETGVAALVKRFLLAMLDQRTDPRIVPGIEAQMPESPFLRMLLLGHPLERNGLGSVVGDAEGSGLKRRLLVFGADAFYREDNDLIVQTASMDGGAPRPDARRATFRGPDVDHMSYFALPAGRQAVDAWLAASGPDGVPGFVVPGPDAPPAPPRGARGDVPARSGQVLLVPDVFGSVLTAETGTVWPNPVDLARRGPDRALDPAVDGRASGLVTDYDALCATLGDRHAVVPMPFDPRRPLADAASALAASLRTRLASGAGPVHLVSHGAGALVVLKALESTELIDRWRASGGRAVLLSPPLDGMWSVLAWEHGRDELTASLALLGGATSAATVGAVLARWPMLADLHPENPDAVERRTALRPESWAGITALYGSAELTIAGREPDGTYRRTSAGDGQVLHPRTGQKGPHAWFALTTHAGLPTDPDVAAGTLDLLAGRRPARLLTAPPAGAPDDVQAVDARGEVLLPTSRGLTRAAWGGGRGGPRPSVLRVEVVHGHLRSARCPVVVGHQDGTPISGAEKAMDTHLEGALERRLAFGQYPGALGACDVFGVADHSSSVAAVIGLGNAGDLTPGALTAAVTQAVLKLAAVHLDREPPDGPQVRMSIASVLVGTALVPAMPVENSLAAIVTGARQANRRLHDLGDRLTVETLQIIELYEERAIQAVHAAKRMVALPGGTAEGDGIVVEPLLVEGCDGKPGMPRPDYQEGVWRTIRIVAADPDDAVNPDKRLAELSFTSIGRSARAEQIVNTGQRYLIDALVNQAIEDPRPDDQLFNTLYELIVPTALKGQGYGTENLMLVVDEQAGVLPLEMLAVRANERGVQPLAVDVGVVRRLETRTFADGIRPAAGRSALVIGDPPTGPERPRLPGARREARLVQRLLESKGYEVTAIIPPRDSTESQVVPILNALFQREYRIVHIAGHGNYAAEDPSRSGVVIGPDSYLGALEIAKMRTTPDLVFLNCCHLGAMRPRTRPDADGEVAPPLPAHRLASSISRRLIENGVRSVVAAGWAVDDAAARDFADQFYSGLLDGQDLGAASLRARKYVHGRYRGTNTWGAYQVYGPPALRLQRPRPDGAGQADLVARRELADAIAALSARAEDADDDGTAAIAEELRDLIDKVPPPWLDGPARSAIGTVWALLARYEQAVACYAAARADWGASVSLKTLEQLANVHAKWAVELARTPGTAGTTPEKQLMAADTLVKQLIELDRTPERLALAGSVAVRRTQYLRARKATSAELTVQLKAARDAYHEAVELSRGPADRVDHYAALNEVWLSAVIALRESRPVDDEPRLLDLIALARDAATRNRCPDFWSRVAPADADLAQALLERAVPERVTAIGDRFLAAFTRSSRRDRTTVLEHIDNVLLGLPSARGKAARELTVLRARLAGT
jgi:CHAT domain-containing protein